MALTPAQLQKRYRHHRAGDHSFCDPARGCELDPDQEYRPLPPPPRPAAPVPVPRTDRPTKFGPRGQELWDAMADVEMGPAHRVLLVEACRLADRLDRFERTLSGGKWFFERVDEDERVEIVIDNVLSEARQYANALKAVVAELEPKPGVAGAPAVPVKKAAGVADLAARIAARRTGTSN